MIFRPQANLSAKSEDLNFFLLSNPMCTILCLKINLGIPESKNEEIMPQTQGTSLNRDGLSK